MTGNHGGPFSREAHWGHCWSASPWPCTWPQPPLWLPHSPRQRQHSSRQASFASQMRVRFPETASTHTWEHFSINVFTYMLSRRCFWLVSSGLLFGSCGKWQHYYWLQYNILVPEFSREAKSTRIFLKQSVKIKNRIFSLNYVANLFVFQMLGIWLKSICESFLSMAIEMWIILLFILSSVFSLLEDRENLHR